LATTKRKKIVVSCLVAAAAGVAIVARLLIQGEREPYRKITLASGRPLRVLRMGRIDVRSGRQTIMIKYETALPIGSPMAVRAEADAIWREMYEDPLIVPLMNQEGITEAVLEATSSPSGFFSIWGTQTYIYRRASNGTWYHISSDE
jgi:hypothetical protein